MFSVLFLFYDPYTPLYRSNPSSAFIFLNHKKSTEVNIIVIHDQLFNFKYKKKMGKSGKIWEHQFQCNSVD